MLFTRVFTLSLFGLFFLAGGVEKRQHNDGVVGPFSIALRPSFRFEWSISNDMLNATMSTNTTSWLGFGLSPTSFLTFHGMNNADIIVADWNSTHTGAAACNLYDMFNPSNFEGAPKLDTFIGGTEDVHLLGCSVVNGWTTASWTRKLSTGDTRDWNITDSGYSHVIIAHGQSQQFGYHGFGNSGTCKLDFFKGVLQEPCKVFWS